MYRHESANNFLGLQSKQFMSRTSVTCEWVTNKYFNKTFYYHVYKNILAISPCFKFRDKSRRYINVILCDFKNVFFQQRYYIYHSPLLIIIVLFMLSITNTSYTYFEKIKPTKITPSAHVSHKIVLLRWFFPRFSFITKRHMLSKMQFTLKKYLPNTWLQFYSAIAANILLLMAGLHFGWPSSAIPKLLDGSHVKVTDNEVFWISVLVILAAIPAALIAGMVLDKVGRKTIILILSIPHFISWLLIAFANCSEILYIARFLAGFADGFIFTVMPMYVGEMADANVRGMLGSLPAIGLILGVVIINSIGQYLSIYITALIASSFSILLVILFVFAPESPYYLISKCNYEEAKQCLRRLKGMEDIDEEFIRITTAIQADFVNKGNLEDLFTIASNRKAMLMVIGLRTIQQFSGTTAISFYTPEILQIPYIVVIYFIVQLFMACLSSVIVDKAGRKPLLILSAAGTGVASICIAIYFYLLENTNIDLTSFKIVPIFAMIAYVVLHSVGLATIPLMMLGEVFPTSVKSIALGVADIYFCFVATAAVKYFSFVQNYIGMYVAFAGFATFSFVGVIFIAIYVPETKGKTLEEIVEIFK